MVCFRLKPHKGSKRGAQTGPNPTDRAKTGVKLHLFVDQKGIPLSVGITGANVHDKHSVADVLDSTRIRSARGPRRPINLCMDKGYDYADVDIALRRRRIQPHIRRRGEQPLLGSPRRRPKRWVVERTISWLLNFRAIRIRWERSAANYSALLALACSLLVFKRSLS